MRSQLLFIAYCAILPGARLMKHGTTGWLKHGDDESVAGTIFAIIRVEELKKIMK
jgi:hypothetical protein